MGELKSSQFFNDGRMRFVRDAWVAARFASITAADAVRLCPDQWPDYEECFGTTINRYEITEAPLAGRRRGAEYKNTTMPDFEWDPGENWIARAREAPVALRKAAELKVAKAYDAVSSAKMRLAIYLSIDEYGIRRKEIEAAMADATAVAGNAFQQVWVLWRGRLYLLWDHGMRSTTVFALRGSEELEVDDAHSGALFASIFKR